MDNMGFLSKILSTKQAGATLTGSSSLLSFINEGYGTSDVQTIRDGLMINPHLYSVVSFQATKVAMMEWGLYRVRNRQKLKAYEKAAFETQDYRTTATKAQALEELEDHKLLKLIENPNPYQSQTEFMEFLAAMLDVTGNGYIWKVRSQQGGNNSQRNRVIELLPLNSAYTEPYQDPKTKEITHYQTNYFGEPIRIERADMIHIKQGQLRTAEDIGRGSYESAGLSIKKSNNANRTEATMLQRGGLFGILSPKQSNSSSNPYASSLKPETKDEIEQDLSERAMNPHSAGSAIIPPVEMDWQQVGLKPSDMNFERARLMSLRDICNCAKVPSQLFNDSEASTYDNMREARKAAYTDAILPKAKRIRNAINQDLLLEYKRQTGDTLYFDFKAQSVPELQQDMTSLVTWLKEAYWLSGNEKREAMDYGRDQDTPEMEEGYFIPSGLKHTSQSGTDDVDIEEAVRRQMEQNQ